ncbi:1-phosphofructokinase family hexose kinase [Aeromicrobium sp.]|uniref:1-phosphofructokinase family hexose kinase n=1 Tax=Aeromicrobium sp. TaxID=1871063 RepID=UPI0025B8CFBF|nr:1-phosphofructokinase family hexose kinase [Aeromicrobium sp.]
MTAARTDLPRLIVTVTANPAIDRLLTLGGPLERGGVARTAAPLDQPGGKGVNVARAVAATGQPVTAVFPAADHDSFVTAVRETGLPHVATPVAPRVRVNLTLAEPDGTTTKLNAPGAELGAAELDDLVRAVLGASVGAAWVALCGSLPSGVPAHWYRDLTARLRGLGARVAVDTSDDPLAAVLSDPATAPDLVKPNAHELVDLLGGDADAVEADPRLAGELAQRLRAERGPAIVLLTLGGAGAVLATAEGTWFATSPPITPLSTVGAGDSALAGYLIADSRGADAPSALVSAVLHGSAAAALPGSTPPRPSDVAALQAPHARELSTTPTPQHP